MLRSDVMRVWEVVSTGMSTRQVASVVGVSHSTVWRLMRNTGGVRPQMSSGSGLRLSLDERCEISVLCAQGMSCRQIAAGLGRAASTISRELTRNRDGTGRCLAWSAQQKADKRAPRPKPSKLATNPCLRDEVEAMLDEKKSPEQIAGRLRRDHPDDPGMRVSHETIYKELYIQARGGLKKQLLGSLRRGRAVRQPRRSQRVRPGVVKDMIMIADRPIEVAERVIPGHWEGDLIMGPQNKSAIGVLVERVSNLLVLLPLPNGHTAERVASAVIDVFTDLPGHLRRSLTWDQGSEMAHHHLVSISTGVEVYFCDPHSPWQRATNENTNGLLRQYFPKGKSLKTYDPDYIRFVEAQMNDRPRKRLGYKTPAEVFHQLLLDPTKTIHDALTP